jgi:hypothetical protein
VNSGLIPQAPFHTASLCVTRKIADDSEENKGKVETVVDHVVEQRISNLVQGLLTLGTMTGPLLTVLGLIPQAVSIPSRFFFFFFHRVMIRLT